MMWSLPITVEVDGTDYVIRNKCDYRVVLDAISALKDEELEVEHRFECALFIFYEDISLLEDMAKKDKSKYFNTVRCLTEEMMKIVNLGEESTVEERRPKLMDWEHDFMQLAPPISRVLGYSVRDEKHYTHWYDFIGAYMEIGECTFSNIVSIRSKRMKGKKLEEWEQEFYQENRKMIDLPRRLTAEEEDFLNFDW